MSVDYYALIPGIAKLRQVSTTRVNGPSSRVTGFHYPSTR